MISARRVLVAVLAGAALTGAVAGCSSDPSSSPDSSATLPSPDPSLPRTTSVPATTTPATTTTMPPPPKLVWSDEFDDPAGTRPDASRWAFDIGGTGWGNRQLEYYSDTNARMDGEGRLLITANPLDVTAAPECWYGACHFMSSRLTTAGIASWQYGRFEISAAFPTGEATWPAFWMLGEDFAEVGWPAAGEIDVVENVGREANVVRGTAHGPGYSASEGVSGSADVANPEEFHVYAVEWSPTRIVWFVDGAEYHRLERTAEREWVFDKKFYLVLDLAVGGLLGGEPGAVDFTTKTLAVDYVRVYAPPT